MNKWTKETLEDVCIKVTDGTHDSPKSVISGGYPLIKGKDISSGFIDFNNCEHISEKDHLDVLKRSRTERGDILFSNIGSVGDCVFVSTDREFSIKNVALFKPNIKIIVPKFLYYIVSGKQFQGEIKNRISGSAQQFASLTLLRKHKVILPPLPTQQKIVKILSNYDDLIENNLKRIKLLEESARLTYEEWFLRFRIDGKKLDIDPESDLPFGWEKKSLGDCVNNYDNQRRPLSRLIREDRSGDYPYYGAASVLDHIDDFIFDGKYLLVGEDGTVQTKEGVPMLQFINCKFWVSNHAHILTGKNISTEFLYLALNVYPISNHITGAAQPKINQQNLNRIPMVIANEDLRAGFDKIILPIFKQIFNLKNQNQLLKEARDILLPRLMTNVIDTDDLDIAV